MSSISFTSACREVIGEVFSGLKLAKLSQVLKLIIGYTTAIISTLSTIALVVWSLMVFLLDTNTLIDNFYDLFMLNLVVFTLSLFMPRVFHKMGWW